MSSRSESRDFIWFVMKLVIAVLLLRSLIVAPFNIPSESMQPRLLIGDYLLVAKWPYGYTRYSFIGNTKLFNGRLLPRTPERGDVIVFAAPANPHEDWIKRVIGLPGDFVQMRHGQIFLNGKPIPKQRVDDLVIPVVPNMIKAAAKEHEPSPCYRPEFEFTAKGGKRMCRYPRFRETLPNGKSYDVLDLFNSEVDDTNVYVVPKGHLFVMGDNRDRSADSRIAVENGGVGLLPMDHLVGRALVSFFSTNGSFQLDNPKTWFSSVRPSRIGKGF